jgi:hypothetical protein
MSIEHIEAVLTDLLSSIGADYCSVLSPVRNIFIQNAYDHADLSRFSMSAPLIGSLIDGVVACDLRSPLQFIIIRFKNRQEIVGIRPIEAGTYLLCLFPRHPNGPIHLWLNQAVETIGSLLKTL